MHSSSILLGALATISLAIPLTPRETCTAPTSFEISNLEFFTDYSDIVDDQTSFSFEFTDLEYNTDVSCSRTNGTINDATASYPCDNENVWFVWSDLKLSIFDTVTCTDGLVLSSA
jgi:hypothetical protein